MHKDPSTSVVVYDPLYAEGERLALAGFLAGYRGATRVLRTPSAVVMDDPLGASRSLSVWSMAPLHLP